MIDEIDTALITEAEVGIGNSGAQKLSYVLSLRSAKNGSVKIGVRIDDDPVEGVKHLIALYRVVGVGYLSEFKGRAIRIRYVRGKGVTGLGHIVDDLWVRV